MSMSHGAAYTMRPSLSELAWPLFAVLLSAGIAFSTLPLTDPETRRAIAWVFFAACGLAAFVAPLRVAAPAVISTLLVHASLTQGMGLSDGTTAGLNASTMMAGAGIAAWLMRFGLKSVLARCRRNTFVWLAAVVLVLDVVSEIRGYRFAMEGLAVLLASYLRVACIVLWAYEIAVRRPARETRSTLLLTLIGPLVVGYSVFSAISTVDPMTADELGVARTSGLADPNFAMLGLAIAILGGLAIALDRRSHPFPRAIVGTAFAAAVLFILLSGSRTAAFSLAVALAAMLLASRRNMAVLLVMAAAAVAVLAWDSIPAPIRDRYTGAVVGYEDARRGAFENATDAFLRAPIFGSGRDTYRFEGRAYGVAAHNTLLTALAEGGVVGCAGVALFLLALLWKAVTLLRAGRGGAGVAAFGVVVVFVVGANGLSLTTGDYCASIFAAACTLVFASAERADVEEATRERAVAGQPLR